MPELPEVEAVRRRIEPAATGRLVTAPPAPASTIERYLAARRIDAVSRRAKNLLLHFGATALRIHLRMTGDLVLTPDVRFFPLTTRFLLEFESHQGILFTDPRALGRIELRDAQALETLDRSLDPEPLSPQLTPEALALSARRSRLPAKLFLMNQAAIAGIGNIYAAEILFNARIHPARSMRRLSCARIENLHTAIRNTLQAAVRYAKAAYSAPGHFHDTFAFPLLVYDRAGQPCLRCGQRVRRIKAGARSTYYCSGCQR